jgi:hypothetical protein
VTPAESDRASLLRQTVRSINKRPGVMLNRLRELERKLAEDTLSPITRAAYERALENLQTAFLAAKRCTDCGRRITTKHAIDISLGSTCERKAVA